MIRLLLADLPNQSLNYPADGVRYELKIYEAERGFLYDIIIDDVPIISGSRLVIQFPLIPYQYREVGNFMIVNDFDSLVNAELMYFSVEDLANARQTA